MNASDISQTSIVREFGARGARLYGKVWFSIMYIMLVAVSAGFWFVGPEFIAGWRRIVVGCFVGSLVIFATSLLTRMRLRFLAEIAELEAQKKMA